MRIVKQMLGNIKHARKGLTHRLDEWEEGPCDRKKTVQRKNTRKSMSVRKDDALFG